MRLFLLMEPMAQSTVPDDRRRTNLQTTGDSIFYTIPITSLDTDTEDDWSFDVANYSGTPTHDDSARTMNNICLWMASVSKTCNCGGIDKACVDLFNLNNRRTCSGTTSARQRHE